VQKCNLFFFIHVHAFSLFYSFLYPCRAFGRVRDSVQIAVRDIRAGLLQPRWFGVDRDAVVLGELHEALRFGLDADIAHRGSIVGFQAPCRGRVHTDDAAFFDLELVAVDIELPLAFQDDVDFLVSLVTVNEGDADCRRQFIDGYLRAGQRKLGVKCYSPKRCVAMSPTDDNM
jgi:hypothetical protein